MKTKSTHIRSVVVITLICLAAAALLSVTYKFTEPRISRANAEKVKAACFEVMPNADDFETFDISDEISSNVPSVKEIYKETTGKGYVFTVTVNGYKPGLTVVCGIDGDGKMTGVRITSGNETESIGGKAKNKDYTDRYIGIASAEEANGWLISGATMTSSAFKNAVSYAFTAYGMLKEA